MSPWRQVSSNARGVSSGGIVSRPECSKPSQGRASGSYGLTDRTTIDARIAVWTDASSGLEGTILLSLSVVALSIRPKYGRDLCVRYHGMARTLKHRSEKRAGLRELVFSRYLEPICVLQRCLRRSIFSYKSRSRVTTTRFFASRVVRICHHYHT